MDGHIRVSLKNQRGSTSYLHLNFGALIILSQIEEDPKQGLVLRPATTSTTVKSGIGCLTCLDLPAVEGKGAVGCIQSRDLRALRSTSLPALGFGFLGFFVA